MASPRRLLLQSPIFLEHDTGGHVENAGRLRAVQRRLEGLADWQTLEPRAATSAEIELVHEPSVDTRIERLTESGGGHLDGDTLVSPHSREAALQAVGGGLRLIEEVCSGSAQQGFALVRPPGHHATPTLSMGFCLYSNLAIAARYARRQLGLHRVLALDWDVHHGNGTQDSLLDEPGVTFVSFHQWPLYPGSGWYDERGQGNLYNLPLPAGCGDGEYLFAMHQLVRPLLERLDPELILVSAGYDAHHNDPLGSMAISSAGFGQMAALLRDWSRLGAARGRLIGFLEGGYHPGALAESVEATLSAWSGQQPVPDCPSLALLTAGFRRRWDEALPFWNLS